VRQTRIRLGLLAVVALVALLALLPATASAKTFKIGTGKVVVTLDPFFNIFLSAGYPMYPVAPASMAFDAPGSRMALPVVGGRWHATLHPHGTFVLKGGFVFIHYTGVPMLKSLSIPAWQAVVGTTTGWTALVNGTRAPILDEDLTTSTTTFPKAHGHRSVKITGVVLTYDNAFTTAFNTAFGTTLSNNEPFGTATLVARLK
jgi:hypothetical protein